MRTVWASCHAVSLTFWIPVHDGQSSLTPRSACRTSPCLPQTAAMTKTRPARENSRTKRESGWTFLCLDDQSIDQKIIVCILTNSFIENADVGIVKRLHVLKSLISQERVFTFIMAFPTFSPRAFLKGMDSIPMTDTEWALSVRAAATSIPAHTKQHFDLITINKII